MQPPNVATRRPETAVRRGLRALVDAERRRAVGAAIVEGYRRRPQKAMTRVGVTA